MHKQSALRTNQAITMAERSMFYPMRGIVQAVRFKNTARGTRTAVDVALLDKTGTTTPDFKGKIITHVPLLYQKMNAQNGEEWTPEAGDLVAVSFFNGNLRDPVVIGYLGPYEGEIMAADETKAPRSYRKRSGTSEEVDKDGNRTTIIQGHETVTVNTGDVTIGVQQGKCTVTIAGKTAWTSAGIDLDGASGGVVKGLVQGDCICPFTKKPHAMVSATVKASK